MRVLLDTNIWNFLALHSSPDSLAEAANAGGCEILVAPAVVYEAVNIDDHFELARRIDLLSHPRWKRLMPEAYSESRDVITWIRSLRPEWLLTQPPWLEAEMLFLDWQPNTKGGFWDRLQSRSREQVGTVRRLQRPMLEAARRALSDARGRGVNPDPEVWNASLQDFVAVRKPTGDGLPSAVKPWRLHAYYHWTPHVCGFDRQPTPLDANDAQVDWLATAVDFMAVQSDIASWNRFWLADLGDHDMPREWVRWAFSVLQEASKLSPGTPGDNQIATYLLEADVFLTGDKAFRRIAEKVRTDGPFGFALTVFVPPGDGGRAAASETLQRIAARDFVVREAGGPGRPH